MHKKRSLERKSGDPERLAKGQDAFVTLLLRPLGVVNNIRLQLQIFFLVVKLIFFCFNSFAVKLKIKVNGSFY